MREAADTCCPQAVFYHMRDENHRSRVVVDSPVENYTQHQNNTPHENHSAGGKNPGILADTPPRHGRISKEWGHLYNPVVAELQVGNL